MVEAYRSILGTAPASFAAPAWLLTRDLFDLEQGAGLAFASDTRGTRPYLPVFEGKEGAIPQLPVTIATLDESLAHAESEGMGYKAVLESFLAKLDRPVGPLGEASHGDLPRKEIRLGRVPGRPYDVCLQSP